jgi:O-antigen ligase
MTQGDAHITIPPKAWYTGLAAAVLATVVLVTATDNWLAAFIPFAALFVLWSLHDLRAIYLLLFAGLPFSVEMYFPNGLGTDLPTEPILIGLSLLTVVYVLRHHRTVSGWLFLHPISIALLLHFAWIGISTLYTTIPVISVKYLLAKSWYIIGFYTLAWLLIDTPDRLRRLMQVYLIALVVAAVYVFIRHAMEGFTFASSNSVMSPIFRNHVDYGCVLTISLPFVWVFLKKKDGRTSKIWAVVLIFLLVAIFFSYLRAAYLTLFVILATYWMVRWRLTRLAIIGAAIAALFSIWTLIHDDTYLKLAPDYEKTIAHKEFDDLLSATAKGEDLSTMERVYRWVAGYNMIREKTWVGFGPGTFYENYRPYTLSTFETYVSDNPDKSGVHSYYLMVFIEQGLIGILLFCALLVVALLTGEKLYHRSTDPVRRRWVMALMMCFVAIATFQIINDLVENDKIGAFFFLCLAVFSRWSSDLPEGKNA